MESDLANLINIVVSGLIGLATGWFFASRGSKELWVIGDAFARIAERQGLVKWQRDEKDRITFGEILEGTGHSRGSSTVSGLAEAIRSTDK